MELKWITIANPSVNNNIFMEQFDYMKYSSCFNDFLALPSGEKGNYKGAEDYIFKETGISLTANQKNYKKFLDEISASIESDNYYSILPVDIHSERETIMDLLASLENEKYIKDVYQKKKLKVSHSGGLNTETAIKLMDSIRQGRSLLESAQTANMLSKPLIDFYAASAYAFASIVINSPLHKALNTLKGSHGHTYNHTDGTVEFGGRIPSGTFIDLLISLYLPQVVTGDNIKFKYSAIPSLDFIQKHEVKLSLISLLSTIPELHSQFLQFDSSNNTIHELKIKSGANKGKITYIFEIGDGRSRPSLLSLKNIFNTENITDLDGKYIVNVESDKITSVLPTIYQDIHGTFWYIDPLIEGLYLPEICTHFLIISALCNIMRYSPYEWNNVLSNKLSSDFSLLISKYLRLFELKYPMLLVQQLTNFLPIIQR